MSTADQPPSKRTRFTIPESAGENETQRPAPSVVARNHIEASARSLPTSVQNYIVTLSTKFHKLKQKERQQTNNLARFDDDDFIPRSARVAFELKGSESVMELDTFQTLATSTTEKVKKFQTDLKSAMKQTIQLEIAATKKSITNCFFQGVKELGALFYLLQHPKTKTD